jgi:phospholipase C
MDSRREFLKKLSVLSGAASMHQLAPHSIRKALGIDPLPGSTYLDAAHVVLLMQENRSFDHCFGTLRGVRGFNDPRVLRLAGGNPAWLQTNAAGDTYAPFRMNFRDTRINWMGSLPHSRESQLDAFNQGRFDRWLEAKKSEDSAYADIPLTMGYYAREDIPFYYDLADAFTICDQHFCSALTPTDPNRLFFWTGTVKEKPDGSAKAHVRNEDQDYGTASWMTFPERLEASGISWKVYQNDISVGTGLDEEGEAWLSNYGDNALEYFSQYHVTSAPRHLQYLKDRLGSLSDEISRLQKELESGSASPQKTKASLDQKRQELRRISHSLEAGVIPGFDQLSEADKALHKKAFDTNELDPLFQQLEELEYKDKDIPRKLKVPRSDVLSQFRKDVNEGTLPAVSWIVAPENFSDHPSAPWYGAFYVSEVLDILTQNPEVWKKTIFLLSYDENDGFFDHVPPFVAPRPGDPGSGKVSRCLDPALEYVFLDQELKQPGLDPKSAREGPIGLGYRVPLIIVSPWSRGGWVCSQVFDHTSSLRFLEGYLSHVSGKNIRETNISAWRRTVSGDLTSAFRPSPEAGTPGPAAVERNSYLEEVYNSRYKKPPSGYKALTGQEIEAIRINPHLSPYLAKQEPGIRPSCALPYELYVESNCISETGDVRISMKASGVFFGAKSSGAPFVIYAPGSFQGAEMRSWSFAVSAGDELTYQWPLKEFAGGVYDLWVYGPNGFFRQFRGTAASPVPTTTCAYSVDTFTGQPDGNLLVQASIIGAKTEIFRIDDHMYGDHSGEFRSGNACKPPGQGRIRLKLAHTYGWYDFSLTAKGYPQFLTRYAGRVECGRPGYSDPVMGKVAAGHPTVL